MFQEAKQTHLTSSPGKGYFTNLAWQEVIASFQHSFPGRRVVHQILNFESYAELATLTVLPNLSVPIQKYYEV